MEHSITPVHLCIPPWSVYPLRDLLHYQSRYLSIYPSLHHSSTSKRTGQRRRLTRVAPHTPHTSHITPTQPHTTHTTTSTHIITSTTHDTSTVQYTWAGRQAVPRSFFISMHLQAFHLVFCSGPATYINPHCLWCIWVHNLGRRLLSLFGGFFRFACIGFWLVGFLTAHAISFLVHTIPMHAHPTLRQQRKKFSRFLIVNQPEISVQSTVNKVGTPKGYQ